MNKRAICSKLFCSLFIHNICAGMGALGRMWAGLAWPGLVLRRVEPAEHDICIFKQIQNVHSAHTQN